MAFSECKTQSHIDVWHHNGVARLTLNRPDRRNAMSRQMLISLTDYLKSTSEDDSFRVLVIQGSNGFFSAGADLDWMKQGKDQTIEENIDDALIFYKAFNALNNYPKPVVAVVEGGAFGGAIGLIACADVVLSTSSSRFAFPEVILGLVPATIAPFVVRKTGHSASRVYMLTGEQFGAQEAKNMGLVHHVVEPDLIGQKTNETIAVLLRNGPDALTATKHLLNKLADGPSSNVSIGDYCAQLIASARASREGQEGVASFIEKRNPYWHNPFLTSNDQ